MIISLNWHNEIDGGVRGVPLTVAIEHSEISTSWTMLEKSLMTGSRKDEFGGALIISDVVALRVKPQSLCAARSEGQPS